MVSVFVFRINLPENLHESRYARPPAVSGRGRKPEEIAPKAGNHGFDGGG